MNTNFTSLSETVHIQTKDLDRVIRQRHRSQVSLWIKHYISICAVSAPVVHLSLIIHHLHGLPTLSANSLQLSLSWMFLEFILISLSFKLQMKVLSASDGNLMNNSYFIYLHDMGIFIHWSTSPNQLSSLMNASSFRPRVYLDSSLTRIFSICSTGCALCVCILPFESWLSLT